MKLGEVVKVCSDPLKNVALKFNKDELDPSFMSNTLAYAVELHKNKSTTNDDIMVNNNPMALIDPSTGEKRKFSTKEECFIRFKESYYNDLKLNDNEETQQVVKSFNLHRFDKEILGELSGNIIDLPEEKCEPMVDVYKVEKRDKTVGVSTNIDEAKKMKEKNPGSVIKNSRGKIVGEKLKIGNQVTSRYEPGSRVEVNNINLYDRFKDLSPSRIISGIYYMYDGRIVNGRIAICKRADIETSMRKIIGFIRVSDLNK